ncbi:hypothetical protein ACSBR2_004641 [Camellia fascicularis]
MAFLPSLENDWELAYNIIRKALSVTIIGDSENSITGKHTSTTNSKPSRAQSGVTAILTVHRHSTTSTIPCCSAIDEVLTPSLPHYRQPSSSLQYQMNSNEWWVLILVKLRFDCRNKEYQIAMGVECIVLLFLAIIRTSYMAFTQL